MIYRPGCITRMGGSSLIFKDRTEGFTLIEILVAITILSFMMISVYTIIDNNIITKETVVAEDREFLQSYTALYRIDQDITQMYSPYYYSWSQIKKDPNNRQSSFGGGYGSSNLAANNRFIPSQYFPKANYKSQPVPLVAQEEKSNLSFMTMANRRYLEGQKQSRFAWVEYSLQADEREASQIPEGGSSVLVRKQISESVFDPNLDFSKVKPQILLRGIKELAFEFWSRKDIKWVDNIRLLPPEERDAIRAVRVILTWIDQNNNERTTIRVFRPLWPYFDAVKDQTERETSENPPRNNPAGGNQQGGQQGRGN